MLARADVNALSLESLRELHYKHETCMCYRNEKNPFPTVLNVHQKAGNLRLMRKIIKLAVVPPDSHTSF